MNTTAIQNWHEANQRYLKAALAVVREALECQVNSERAQEGRDKGTKRQGDKEEDERKLNQQQTTDSRFPLAILCNAFGLSPFERDVLLLCAGIELDSSFASLCAAAQADPRRTYPTFSLALSVFPESHWSAITPVSPLRRWRLIEVSTVDTLTLSPLRIDERVLHYLTGVSYLDDRLQGLIKLVPQGEWELPPSHQSLVHQIAEIFQREGTARLAIQLCGNEPALKQAIAASACSALGWQLYSIRAADLPQSVTEREALARLWERESVLSNSALLLDCEALDSKDKEASALSFLETVGSSVILASSEPLRTRDSRPTLCLNVNKLSTSEQQKLWQSALGSLAEELNGQLEILVSQFNLSFSNIQAASTEAIKMGNGQDASPSPLLLLWDACRVQHVPASTIWRSGLLLVPVGMIWCCQNPNDKSCEI